MRDTYYCPIVWGSGFPSIIQTQSQSSTVAWAWDSVPVRSGATVLSVCELRAVSHAMCAVCVWLCRADSSHVSLCIDRVTLTVMF